MTNDRELLELAAKAAGYNDPIFVKQIGKIWNPLTDDGDALRLAVKLGMSLGLPEERSVYVEAIGNCQILERVKDDPYAATRRAIVRAAASIGETM